MIDRTPKTNKTFQSPPSKLEIYLSRIPMEELTPHGAAKAAAQIQPPAVPNRPSASPSNANSKPLGVSSWWSKRS